MGATSTSTKAAVGGIVAALAAAAGTLLHPGGESEPPMFADGFESGDLTAWTSSTGLVVQDAVVAEGTYAARATMTGAAAYATRTLSATTSAAMVRLRLNLQSQSGPTSVNFVKLRTATGTAIAEIYVTPDRALGLRNDVTAVSTDSSIVMDTGVWHEITFRSTVAGGSSTSEVTYDGVVVPALSLTHDLGLSPIGRIQMGENVTGRTAELAYDAVEVTAPTVLPGRSPSLSGAVTGSPSTSARPSPSESPSFDASSGPRPSYPVLAAAGDIACDPLKSNDNAGSGTGRECAMKAVSDAILADSSITAVAALGDIQYECGGLAAFQDSYHPTWGRLRSITRPAVGNHEYLTSSASTAATDCDPTGRAVGYYTYFGALAGDPEKGYYSYDLGPWHIVVLNTQCSQVGGCGKGSPQERWLRADLAAHPSLCTLAYYHIPLWSSGGRASRNSKDLVADLVAAEAEVVLAGHDHTYERFAPMDSAGNVTSDGIRSFVVGTGGANHTSFVTIAPHSQARNDDTYGFLRLSLRQGAYDWQFVPVGGSYTDSGTGTCH